MLLKTTAIFALCCAFVLAQDDGVPTQPAIPTQPPTSQPTTSPKTSTTTKTPTTSKTSTTTKTTIPPTTTTVQPTTAEPATTLAPPTKGLYIVKEGNETCLMATLAVQIKLEIEDKIAEFDIPGNASFNGTCLNETQELTLFWEEQSKTYTLTFQFAKNDTTKKFMVSQIILKVPQQNGTLNLTDEEPEFTTSISKSYLCDKQQEIKLAEEGTNTTYAVLKVSHVQLQAFHTSGDEKFLAAENCFSSSSPDIVPIAVGCALVGLIAIVLIAYLVGRRRSQARGYLSM